METGLFPTVETIFSEQPPSKCWNGFCRNRNDAKILVFHRHMKRACIDDSCGVTRWISHRIDNRVEAWYSVNSLVMRTSMGLFASNHAIQKVVSLNAKGNEL